MREKELNDKIEEVCEDIGQYEAFGERSIPYIGWFWRYVYFDGHDKETYNFTVIPSDKTGGRPLVGFAQNNKWFYDTVHADKEQWAEIKALLITAVEDPTHDNLKALNEKIQSLIDGKEDMYKTAPDPYKEEWT